MVTFFITCQPFVYGGISCQGRSRYGGAIGHAWRFTRLWGSTWLGGRLSRMSCTLLFLILIDLPTEWRTYTETRPEWYLCHQQATSEQADLVILSSEVRHRLPPIHAGLIGLHCSGPKRYDFHEGTLEWVYSRDGQSINALLSEELSTVFKEPVNFRL